MPDFTTITEARSTLGRIGRPPKPRPPLDESLVRQIVAELAAQIAPDAGALERRGLLRKKATQARIRPLAETARDRARLRNAILAQMIGGAA